MLLREFVDWFRAYTEQVFDTSIESLFKHMPVWVKELSVALPSFALDGSVYVVGGIVRDALLERKSRDVDLVVEGLPARELAEQLGPFLQKYFQSEATFEIPFEIPFEIHCHDEFGTCTVHIEDIAVDVAQARAETYPHPASLPLVTFSTLKNDLKRRDYTINALAVELYPNKGTFHDPFLGLADLETKTLRILHEESFKDDPTRIIRGARLAGRLDGQFEPKSKDLVATGLTDDVLEQISPARLRAELELCLQEAQVLPSIKQLCEVGALKSLFAINESSFELIAALDEKRLLQVVDADSYLLALFLSLSDIDLKQLVERYDWSMHYLRLHALLSDIRQSNSLSDRFLKKVNDELYGLKNEAVSLLLEVMSPELKQQVQWLQDVELRPKLTGQDVLNLLALQGSSGESSQIGDVLLAVGKARAAGTLLSYEQEIDYATHYIKNKTK